MLASEVPTLSDEELRAQLIALGVDVGPIMGSTRKLYQRKLVRLLGGDDADALLKCSTLRVNSSFDDSGGGDEAEFCVRERHLPRFSPSPPRPSQTPGSKGNQDMSSSTTSVTANQRNSPFPAANAQFRKHQSSNDGSMTDQLMKFACFFVVVLVILYFIVTQDVGTEVELQS